MGGPMELLRFARVDTSEGPMLVAESDLGVAAVSRGGPLTTFLDALQRRFPGAEIVPAELDAGWLDDVFRGTEASLSTIDLRGIPDFDARVYEVVRAIPRGERLTYGEVAALIGSPGAARAVGGAMARCPLFPAVPCHRVVRAADGWSGWGSDDAFKRRLLDLERR